MLKRAARVELVFYETEIHLYRKWRGRLLFSLVVAFFFQRCALLLSHPSPSPPRPHLTSPRRNKDYGTALKFLFEAQSLAVE